MCWSLCRPVSSRFPGRAGRLDRPGIAVLGDVTFPVEREGLDVVAKDEAEFGVAGVFDFVGPGR